MKVPRRVRATGFEVSSCSADDVDGFAGADRLREHRGAVARHDDAIGEAEEGRVGVVAVARSAEQGDAGAAAASLLDPEGDGGGAPTRGEHEVGPGWGEVRS